MKRFLILFIVVALLLAVIVVYGMSHSPDDLHNLLDRGSASEETPGAHTTTTAKTDSIDPEIGIVIVAGALIIIIILITANSSSDSVHGGRVRVQFNRSRSGSRVATGLGDSVGSAMADGFAKLYNGLSPNSRLDTIQSRYDSMIHNLDSNRSRMNRQDIEACESYIRRTKILLDRKQAEADSKARELAEAERLVRERQASQRVDRRFVAAQRRLMTDSLRYDVMQRDGFRCKLCGATADDGYKLHVDHIIPVSKGGKTEISNLRTLCERCNMGKRDKIERPSEEVGDWLTPEEFAARYAEK